MFFGAPAMDARKASHPSRRRDSRHQAAKPAVRKEAQGAAIRSERVDPAIGSSACALPAEIPGMKPVATVEMACAPGSSSLDAALAQVLVMGWPWMRVRHLTSRRRDSSNQAAKRAVGKEAPSAAIRSERVDPAIGSSACALPAEIPGMKPVATMSRCIRRLQPSAAQVLQLRNDAARLPSVRGLR